MKDLRLGRVKVAQYQKADVAVVRIGWLSLGLELGNNSILNQSTLAARRRYIGWYAKRGANHLSYILSKIEPWTLEIEVVVVPTSQMVLIWNERRSRYEREFSSPESNSRKWSIRLDRQSRWYPIGSWFQSKWKQYASILACIQFLDDQSACCAVFSTRNHWREQSPKLEWCAWILPPHQDPERFLFESCLRGCSWNCSHSAACHWEATQIQAILVGVRLGIERKSRLDLRPQVETPSRGVVGAGTRLARSTMK